MPIENWVFMEDKKDYIVWKRNETRDGNYNGFFVVAKTEEGKWVVFVDAGDGGHKILGHPINRKRAVELAKQYMRTH